MNMMRNPLKETGDAHQQHLNWVGMLGGESSVEPESQTSVSEAEGNGCWGLQVPSEGEEAHCSWSVLSGQAILVPRFQDRHEPKKWPLNMMVSSRC